MTPKANVRQYIDGIRTRLIKVSSEIFNNPELAFEEVKASRLLADELKQAGFDVELGVAGLTTAIRAEHSSKSEGPTIAILAEYDALPGLGHACGHNLIAAAALGAALALGEMKKDLPGRLVFLGTPAEEDKGGKIDMIAAGLFEEIDAAMMFHPSAGYTMVGRQGLALTEVKIEFFGKPAHAAASPEKGINALDAVIQTFNGINALRQHIKSDARIHGVITHGGVKPNIVPEYASAEFYVRALKDDYCAELVRKLEGCARGAASATGAELKFEIVEPSYMSRKMNKAMGNAFASNLELLGLSISPLPEGSGLGSSDIGNVSQVVPAIHPYLHICHANVSGHSQEFAEAANSEYGHEAMLNAAKALAMTAVDLFMDSELMKQVREEFQKTN
ncbi:MAG: M20 family metallopeptidase [Candidatus Thorarchaeota archaeon]|nr:MAG: M20 family metallopeptidase [Candidatus Thorarchaeota archaeon]